MRGLVRCKRMFFAGVYIYIYKYLLSEDEIAAKVECKITKRVCWENILSLICKTITIDCPDYSGHMFLSSNETWSAFNATLPNVDLASETQDFLIQIFERMNIVASVYCLYLAALIFIGPAYNITKGNIINRFQNVLGLLTKSYFIISVLILWYLIDALIYFLNILITQTDIFLLLKYMTIDPCFADTDFVISLYNGAMEICTNMSIAENENALTLSNVDYLYSVEDTYYTTLFCTDGTGSTDQCPDYTKTESSDRIYDTADIWENKHDLYWDTNVLTCEFDQFMSIIQPSITNDESSFDFYTLFISSGAIGALMLQPILANFLVNFFVVVFDPLCCVNGRVLLPMGDATDFQTTPKAELRNAIKMFIRFNHIGLLVVYTILLIFVCANLFTSSVL